MGVKWRKALLIRRCSSWTAYGSFVHVTFPSFQSVLFLLTSVPRPNFLAYFSYPPKSGCIQVLLTCNTDPHPRPDCMFMTCSLVSIDRLPLQPVRLSSQIALQWACELGRSPPQLLVAGLLVTNRLAQLPPLLPLTSSTLSLCPLSVRQPLLCAFSGDNRKRAKLGRIISVLLLFEQVNALADFWRKALAY